MKENSNWIYPGVRFDIRARFQLINFSSYSITNNRTDIVQDTNQY